MIADTDLQVWLDTQANTSQRMLVPYVKSVRDIQVTYRMDVIQRGGAGTSRISQQGKVDAIAAQPTALGRVALGLQNVGECRVEITLRENQKDLGVYNFDCMP